MFQKLIRGNVAPDFRETSGLLGTCISMSWISTPQTFHQLYPHTQVQKIRHANIYDAGTIPLVVTPRWVNSGLV